MIRTGPGLEAACASMFNKVCTECAVLLVSIITRDSCRDLRKTRRHRKPSRSYVGRARVHVNINNKNQTEAHGLQILKSEALIETQRNGNSTRDRSIGLPPFRAQTGTGSGVPLPLPLLLTVTSPNSRIERRIFIRNEQSLTNAGFD